MFRIAIRCVRKDGVATAVPDRVSRADPDLVRVMTSVCAEVSGWGAISMRILDTVSSGFVRKAR